jgi:hypothetical protein
VIGAEIIGTLDREDFCEPAAGAVDPTLDGADGAAADLSGFFVGEAGGADEDGDSTASAFATVLRAGKWHSDSKPSACSA